MHKPWSFTIITLGCKVNQYESQAITEAWKAIGGIQAKDLQQSDVALINSCAITSKGERDTRNALYSIKRANPDALCILSGCASTLVPEHLDPQENYYDIIVPPRAKSLLMQGPWQWAHKTYPYILPNESNPPLPFGEDGFKINSFKRSRPIIKVQDGCSHGCTYCIVPLVRGPSISRAPEEILLEAQRLLEAGFCEILLSGINLHHYARGLSHKTIKDFWDLVKFLDRNLAPLWLGKARLRISSLEPSQINNKALDVLQSSRLFCPQLHLSLQNGSMRILRAMGRGHCKLDILAQAIKELRTTWKYMGLGADILMGFPGEEDVDVQETLALIQDLKLSYAHVFPYSKRPGTKASTLPMQVQHQLKLARAAQVRSLVEEQKLSFLKALLEKKDLQIVVDNNDILQKKQIYKAIDAHYAPCRLEIETNKTLHGIISVKAVAIKEQSLIVSL